MTRERNVFSIRGFQTIVDRKHTEGIYIYHLRTEKESYTGKWIINNE
jgi:hypothetical protein